MQQFGPEVILKKIQPMETIGPDLHLQQYCTLRPGALADPDGLVRLAQRGRDGLLASKDAIRQSWSMLALWVAHLRAEAPSRAEPVFRAVIAREPDGPFRAKGAAWLAKSLLHQGRRDEAKTWFDQADRFIRARVPGGRPELEHRPPEAVSRWGWWQLLLAWREAQALLLDGPFPADPFAH